MSFSLGVGSFSLCYTMGSNWHSETRLGGTNIAGASHGWSFNSCMVILVFGFTSRQLLSTVRHSWLSYPAMELGSLYLPALMLSMVSLGEPPRKGNYPTSMP
jgi:hypothetical protein